MIIFELSDIKYNKDNINILNNINLKILENQIYTLIGPSGSGKSTFLQMFNRLIDPTSGTITYYESDIKAKEVIGLRKEIGMVFQQPFLFEGTVFDNLNYGYKLIGKTLEKEIAFKYLKLVDLNAKLLETKVDSLSGGQQQRVALARALANCPRVLLLDEPTSALDPSATEIIETTILDLKKKLNLTIIWVTHNMDQAKRVGDHTLLLDKGEIIEFNRTQEFFNFPHNPTTLNFISGHLKEVD